MITFTRHGPMPAPQRPAVADGVAAAEHGTRNTSPPCSDNPVERAIRGAAEQPLSRGQKTHLVLLAKCAWQKLSLTRPELGGFDAWRHAESITACTRRISEAHNADFLSLRGHFRNLLGAAGAAFDDAFNDATSDQRIAMHALAKACAQRALPLEYPAAIGWTQFKCALKDATAKQLWRLVFTIRNRRKPAASVKGQESTVKAAKTRDYTLKQGGTFKPKPTTEDPF